MLKKKRIYTSISSYIPQVFNKPVFITKHAIIRARERDIAFPDQVYHTISTGKVKRIGKEGLRIVGKKIICVGIEKQEVIIIKTVERK